MEEKNTFEDKLARLEEIATDMESGSLGLKKSVESYEEASKIIKDLENELKKASEKVKVLVDEEGDEGSLEDFNEVEAHEPF